VILGVGRSMGARRIEAVEIARGAGVTPEWIETRTGISGIHVQTGPLAAHAREACELALKDAGLEASQIGLVIVATCTSDYLFPSMAAGLCRDLGIRDAMAFDLQANCSGFVAAFVVAAQLLTGYALVVGAEGLSQYADPTNIESILFVSDGAGAVVMGPGRQITAEFLADGSNYESVRCKRDGTVEMQGLATWKQTVTHLPTVCREAVERAGWDRPDLVIFHQANLRMIDFLMSRLGWPPEIGFTNVERVGNVGAASIPVAIADAKAADRLHGRILLAGVGAGFTFGAAAWEQE
jgi:3-oxoacyl-[acyl-carrier-protein] synthase-3